MKPSLLLKAIPAINRGSFSIDEFALTAGLGKRIATDLVRFLAINEIGEIHSTQIEFGPSDKIQASLLAMQMGADTEDVSQLLNWKYFEVLATSLLSGNGYITKHGFRLKRPRLEIDVVGIKDSMALLIDCKHWRRSSLSTLKKFASMQVQRAKAFLAVDNNVGYAIPVILTLHSESTVFANNIPVVPITKFRSFLNDITGYFDDIKIVYA
ncbi:MAG: hypothetical protein ACE5KA_01785 [Nitrososphaerales archaeon]